MNFLLCKCLVLDLGVPLATIIKISSACFSLTSLTFKDNPSHQRELRLYLAEMVKAESGRQGPRGGCRRLELSPCNDIYIQGWPQTKSWEGKKIVFEHSW